MEIVNIFNLMTSGMAGELCGSIGPILGLVGYVILAIRVGVPIILIIMGMVGFAKAMSEKDEGKMKEAQKLLIKRLIYAAAVFFVVPIVNLLMSVILGQTDYKECVGCINNPTETRCKPSNIDGGI